MKVYPHVADEDNTVFLLRSGQSIARFGDGELKLCLGHNCISQDHTPKLEKALRNVLRNTSPTLLVGIPNIVSKTPKIEFWGKYTLPKYVNLLNPDMEYFSSFITRPDSAPWIDRPDYWQSIQRLWAGEDITIVRAEGKGLRDHHLKAAKSITEILCEEKNAFDHYHSLIEKVKKVNNRVVILCCGPTATVMAAELDEDAYHALDLGHMGMFLDHKGVYGIEPESLISQEYLQQNAMLHTAPAGYGGGGYKQLNSVLKFAIETESKSILDYGCGEGTLKKAIKESGWEHYVGEYDPAIYHKAVLPKPADLVVCSDVLEHIERDKICNVLCHIGRLAKKGIYLYIATRPANKFLPDGRNTHLIVEGWKWWQQIIEKLLPDLGWGIQSMFVDGEHSVKFWLTKEEKCQN